MRRSTPLTRIISTSAKDGVLTFGIGGAEDMSVAARLRGA